jgi:hypothetical protein
MKISDGERGRIAMMRIGLMVSLAAGMLLGAPSAVATTYVVGTCQPRLKMFTTIEAAVLASSAGGTVWVCPGTYPEQVTISGPLTLAGLSSGDAGRAVIAVPPNGLQVNATSIQGGFPVAAQVLVTAGTPSVNITDITVDGSGNNLSSADLLAGIFYDVGTSGTVNKVTTRNQLGAAEGIGIWAQNSLASNYSVTIENSSVHDVNFIGIFVLSNQTPPTLTATVKGNRVVTYENGILDQAGGTVTGNFISAGFTAIALQNGSSASVTGNTLTDAQVGITVGNGGNVVKSNVIWNSQYGIDLFGNGATIQSNNVAKATVGIKFGCFTGTVSGNTINDAGTGIDTVPSSFTLVNTFENVDTIRAGGC